MITLTFQFDSIEAAQDFLGAVNSPKSETVITPDVAGKKERKPRADAGQPRGPYKRKDESEAAAPATVPAETPPAAPEAAAAGPVELALADVRAAMTGRSTDKNIALLKKFGYPKSSELPPALYAEFIAACKRGE